MGQGTRETLQITWTKVKKKLKKPTSIKAHRESKPLYDDIIEEEEYTYFQYNKVPWSNKEKYIDRVIEWLFKYASEWFYWNPVPPYIREMISEMLYGHKRVMLEPRYHGKTNTLLCLFAYWIIELRRTVMVVVQMDEMQRNYFEWMIAIFKGEAVIKDYGELLHRVSGKPAYSIKLIPSYQTGVPWAFFKASSISGGYVGQHPDWTHLDDLIQKIVRSSETFDFFMRDFDGNVLDLSPDKLTVSGTRKDIGDFYDMIFDKGFIPLHRKAVIFTKGDFPTIPDDFHTEVVEYAGKLIKEATGLKQEYVDSVEYELLGRPGFTFEKLMIRYYDSPNSFFSQLQNEPIPPAGGKLKREWWQPMSPFTQGELTNSFQLWVDPAFGKSTSASFAAIMVCAPYQGNFYIVDMILDHFGEEELKFKVISTANKYGIRILKMENDFMQITNRYSEIDFPGFVVEPFYNRGEGEKMKRISTLTGPAMRREFYIYDTCEDFQEFHYQWLKFNPKFKKGRFDGLDILISAYRENRKNLGKFKNKGTIIISV